MKHVTVLYDPTCGFCVKCRRWLETQPKLIEMRFLPQGSRKARERFLNLTFKTDEEGRPDELIVIDDKGNVYRDDKAWVICFYCLRKYRGLSMKLARPGMAGLARRAYTVISDNRRAVSTLLGGDPEAVEKLRDVQDEPRCHDALCALRTARENAATANR